MRKLFLLVVFLLPTISLAARPDVPPGLSNEANNSFIFVFKDHVKAEDVPGLAKGLVKQAEGTIRNQFTTAIKGFSANMSLTAAINLAERNPNIAYFEPNGVASIGGKSRGSKGGKGGNPLSSPQVTPWGITRVGGSMDATGKHVWIIDSGIDANNADLNVDTTNSWNLTGNKSDNDFWDRNGHGTHVSGTLAAIDNNLGVVGVASNASIRAIRVFGASGQGFVDDIVEGVDWVAAHGTSGDVVNMSIITTGLFDSLHDAIVSAANNGFKFSVCAGNDSELVTLSDPGRVEHANVNVVSAIDDTDTFASFSNYGNPTIDFAAPGVGVDSYVLNNYIRNWEGCSMAVPHVSGIMLFGSVNTDGSAVNDPDTNPDPIAHF